MLVILHKCDRLLQVFASEMVLQQLVELINNRYFVLAYDDAVHVGRLDLRVPIMLPQQAY